MTQEQNFFSAIDKCLSDTNDLTLYYKTALIPAREGSFAPIDDLSIHPSLKNYIQTKFPKGLYKHQYEAVNKYCQGENIIATTQTASGKSLIYSIPAFNEVLQDENSTALFIYPQKALANDQLNSLSSMWKDLIGTEKHSLKVSRYDASVPENIRGDIRDCGQMILTNPEMLHYAMLAWHNKWSRFFSNLKLVAIDEVHEYTGAFGGNFAYIMRRLRNICRFYGSSPVFITTSATIESPKEHAGKLTGLDFTHIPHTSDTSARGAKKYYLAGPAEENNYEFVKSLIYKLRGLGLSTLIFCPSRKTAEQLASQQSQALSEGWLKVYRSGLSADERQSIEQGLKSGSVTTVFSTNALELGIDIGALDVVICIGVPPTMMSFVQRTGRIARVNKPGAVIIIPRETPIDSFYASNPQALFERSFETANITMNNNYLAKRHAACALYEVVHPEEMDYQILGENIRNAVDAVMSEFHSSEPHRMVSIRGNFGGQYEIVHNRQLIGTIDEYHLLREAYPYAIYRHGGRCYEVTSVSQQGRREVYVKPHKSHYNTTPIITTQVYRGEELKVKSSDRLAIVNSCLTVTESLTAVTKKSPKGETLPCNFRSGMLRPFRFHTTGSYLHIKPQLMSELIAQLPGKDLQMAFSGIYRLFSQLFTTIIQNCDSQDIASALDIKDNSAYLYLYDQVEGGIDITTGAFEHWDKLIERVSERISECSCQGDEGCFKCIANPDVYEPVSKSLALKLLSILKNELACGSFKERTAELAPEIKQLHNRSCPVCGANTQSEARFCSNCGERLTPQTIKEQ